MVSFKYPAVALFLSCGVAQADPRPLAISIELADDATLQSTSFSCDTGERFVVSYVRSEDDLLALVPVNGRDRIFVNVTAGSGDKYVSGSYSWWARGTEARLEDSLNQDSPLICRSES